MKKLRHRLVKDSSTGLKVTKSTKGTHPVKKAASLLPPPKGYASWLDYAVTNVSTRELFHDHLWGNQPQWPPGLTRDDFEVAMQKELALLRKERFLALWGSRPDSPAVPEHRSPSQETLPTLVAWVFPDTNSARVWMRVACAGLGGKIPARLMKTRKGRAEVKAFLIGVGSGNFM